MERETREVIDSLKKQTVEATANMDREEREELFSALHEWAYSHYQDALLEGYDPEAEMQDYENDKS